MWAWSAARRHCSVHRSSSQWTVCCTSAAAPDASSVEVGGAADVAAHAGQVRRHDVAAGAECLGDRDRHAVGVVAAVGVQVHAGATDEVDDLVERRVHQDLDRCVELVAPGHDLVGLVLDQVAAAQRQHEAMVGAAGRGREERLVVLRPQPHPGTHDEPPVLAGARREPVLIERHRQGTLARVGWTGEVGEQVHHHAGVVEQVAEDGGLVIEPVAAHGHRQPRLPGPWAVAAHRCAASG